MASIDHQSLETFEGLSTLRSIGVFLVEQFNAVLEQLRSEREEKWVEYLVVSNVCSVVLLNYIPNPFWNLFLNIVKTNILNALLDLALLVNDLAQLTFQLLLIYEHVGSFAPVCACLLEYLHVSIAHVAAVALLPDAAG